MKHPRTGQIQDCTLTGHQNMAGITGGWVGALGSACNGEECRSSCEKQGFVCPGGS